MADSLKSCDILIDDVTLLSPGEPLRRNWSIAIVGNKILDVGPSKTFPQLSPTYLIKAQGSLCLPGLINTHNHTPLMSVRGMAEDLGFAPAYIPGVPQGHWLGDEETLALARLGLVELLTQGCTTVVDFYARPRVLAQAMNEVGLRGFVGGRIMDVDTALLADGQFALKPELGEKTLADNIALIEEWSNRKNNRISCVLSPHAVDTCSPTTLRRVAEIAEEKNLQVHSHLSQSKLEVERVRQLYNKRSSEVLDDVGLLSKRLVAAHCIHLDNDEIERIAVSGTAVAHVPLGNSTAGQIAPIVDLNAAGARITLATDSKSGDMFETMRNAIKMARIKNDGKFVLDASTVFDWATVGGASALGLKNRLGRIARNYLADLILLDNSAPNLRPVVDGVGIVVYSGMGANVRTLICDGEVLLENGKPTKIDIERIITEAQKVADFIWKRARN